jgi:aspartate carbamoyltransferase catalytic subunit
MRHILNAQQFDRVILQQLFNRANEFRARIEVPLERTALTQLYRGKMLFSVFYEPSTRTRMSFSAAAEHLGMSVVTTENAGEFSSAVKGESLEDSIRVLCEYYPDAIVVRHPYRGAADRAAGVSSVPIINAGDGNGQHPTQALLDLYTIYEALGGIDDITVTLGGDLENGRTARSLAYLLAKFKDIRIIFISPSNLGLSEDLREYLAGKSNIHFEEREEFGDALEVSDVVYWTRIQKERAIAESPENFIIGLEEVSRMKPDAILMHPLPRLTEIPIGVDSDHRAWYFRQAGNGMLIRMALLEWIISEKVA